MELGQLYWSTGLNTSGLQKDSSKAKGILGKLSGGMGGMFNPAAIGISAVAGAALKLGKDAYEFSKQFNSAMLEVKTISASAQEDFAGMSQGILDISLKGVNDDAIGLSKAMYQVVSAGYDGAEGLAILEASAKAATGGVTDTITAADGLTTVLNAWGMSASDVNNVSDQMFTTVKLGKTTMGELGQNIAKVAPLAAATGIAFEEVAAATATMTSQGTPTTEVMTQMKAAIVALNKNLGDGWAATMTMQEGMMKMRDMAGGSDTKLQELTGSSEAMLAVLSMTGANAEKASEHLNNMGASAGAANEAFKTMGQDADILWKQVGNQFKASMVDIGDGLVQASAGLAKFLSASLTGKDQLSENFEEIGEGVDSFSERMKVLKNEGNGFWSAIAGAAVRSNESIQKVVDNEKAEVQSTVNEIKALNDEYVRLQESGASEGELTIFKQNLVERYTAMKKATDAELEIANKRAKQSKIFAVATLGLGSGTASAEGIKAKDIKDQADNLAKTLEAVIKLGVEEAEVKPEMEIQPIFNIKNINDLEKELKELQDKKGSFYDPKDEIKNIELIRKKQKQIDDEWMKVREAQHGKIEEIKELKTEQVEVTATETMQLDDQLVGLTKLTDEEKDRLTEQQKQELSVERQLQLIKETTEFTRLISGIFGQMGQGIGRYNQDIGKVLTDFADLTSMSADFADIMGKSGDKSINDYLSIIGLIAGMSEILFNTVMGPLSNWMDKIFNKGRDQIVREAGQSYWDAVWDPIFNGAEDAMDNLFSGDSIASNIVDGIMSGFELAEDGLGDFGDGFNKVLSDAARQALITTFTDKSLADLMTKFTAAFEDGLTEEERASLQEDYQNAIKEAQEQAKAWESILNLPSQGAQDVDAGGFGKAITSITEETGSLIEGQFNAMRVANLKAIDIMDEHTGYLSEIAINTLETNKLLGAMIASKTTDDAAPKTSYVR